MGNFFINTILFIEIYALPRSFASDSYYIYIYIYLIDTNIVKIQIDYIEYNALGHCKIEF